MNGPKHLVCFEDYVKSWSNDRVVNVLKALGFPLPQNLHLSLFHVHFFISSVDDHVTWGRSYLDCQLVFEPLSTGRIRNEGERCL